MVHIKWFVPCHSLTDSLDMSPTLTISLTLTLTLALTLALTLNLQGEKRGPTCGGGGIRHTEMRVSCGMGATSLYDSLTLDQVPPTLI